MADKVLLPKLPDLRECAFVMRGTAPEMKAEVAGEEFLKGPGEYIMVIYRAPAVWKPCSNCQSVSLGPEDNSCPACGEPAQ